MKDTCLVVRSITANMRTKTARVVSSSTSSERLVMAVNGTSPGEDPSCPSRMESPSSDCTSTNNNSNNNHHHQQQQQSHAHCNGEDSVIDMGSSSLSAAHSPYRSSQVSPLLYGGSNGNSGSHCTQYHHSCLEQEQEEKIGSPKHVTDDSETSENVGSQRKRKSSMDGTDDSVDETNHDQTTVQTIRQQQQQQQNPQAEDHPSRMNGTHNGNHQQNEGSDDMIHQSQDGKDEGQKQPQVQQRQNGVLTPTHAGPWGGAQCNSFSGGQQQQHEHGTDPGCVPTLPQHERIQEVEPLDISYRCTPASLKLKEMLLSRLSVTTHTGRIQVIDLSRRGLGENDAELIGTTLASNPQLAVLKLGYNNLSDRGASIIASACSKDGRHHPNLTILDLGFNSIGDDGCTSLCLHMLAGNHTLRNLFLSGNNIQQRGAIAVASAILHGCSLSRLHLSANRLGALGIEVLAQAIAEAEARIQQLLQRQGGIKAGFAVKPVALEELHLDDTDMQSESLRALSSMLMTNHSLKVISLANNDIDDRQMACLSQALTQNKQLPLKSLILSFNKITCVGVECLMNAVWGSPTLTEIKLDNNKMQDRGAQLCSVVLGSIRLEVLDVSFNRISTVGIKAIMKSLSENDSLQVLSLSGIPMDQNASKAVSYALAYNQSLHTLFIDSCSVGYSGQRYIAAGIVSNRNMKLRVVNGFALAPITMTLGLPQLPEDWGNDRVLGFVRFMWTQWQSTGSLVARKENDNTSNESRGPAPPSMVAAAAKMAFASLSQSDDAKALLQEEYQTNVDDNPMIAPDTAILVRSNSGHNLQIPSWDCQLQEVAEEANADFAQDSWSSETDSLDRSSYTGSSESLHNIAAVSNERRNMNLAWLRAHIQSLNEVGNLPFNNADLWQLHQYFYSPAYTAEDDFDPETDENEDDKQDESKVLSSSPSQDAASASPPTSLHPGTEKVGMGRAMSFQTLRSEGAAVDAQRPNKRGSLDEELKYHKEPKAKRAKNLKPRIAFYSRVREKLESLGTKPSAQTLSLLRQLKYLESVMLHGTNVYAHRDEQDEVGVPNASDVEMILLDLL